MDFLYEIGIPRTKEEPLPTMATLFKQINSRIDSLKNSDSKFSENNFFRPKFAFKTTDGLSFKNFGDSISEKEMLLEGRIPDDLFIEILDKGYYVISGIKPIESVANGLTTGLDHDLFYHYWKFLQYPEYMSALRQGVRDFRHSFDKTDFEKKQWMNRFTICIESLEIVESSNVPLILDIFELSHKDNGSYTIDEIENSLRRSLKGRQPWLFVQQLLLKLNNNLKKIINPVGGTAVDLYDKYILRYHDENPFLIPPIHLLIQKITKEIRISRTREENVREPKLLKTTAGLALLMLEMSRITPEEWTREALKIKVSKNSKLFEIICKTGIFGNNDPIFQVHCL